MAFARKTIEEMDREFAAEAGYTFEEWQEMDWLRQQDIVKVITNKRLKAQKK